MISNSPMILLAAAAATLVMIAADVGSVDVKMSVTDNDKLAKVNVEHKDEIRLDLMEKQLDKKGQRLLSVVYYKPPLKGSKQPGSSPGSGEANKMSTTLASGMETAGVTKPSSSSSAEDVANLQPTVAPSLPPLSPSPGLDLETAASTTPPSSTSSTSSSGGAGGGGSGEGKEEESVEEVEVVEVTTPAVVTELPGGGGGGTVAEVTVPGLGAETPHGEKTSPPSPEGDSQEGAATGDDDYDGWLMPTVAFPGRRMLMDSETAPSEGPFFVYDDASDWAAAGRNCANRGSELVVPKDNAVKDIVKDLLKDKAHTSEAWVGLQQVKGDDVFKDGAGVCYNNKGKMNCPQHFAPEGKCVVMTDSGLLQSRLCNQKLPYVCHIVG